MIGISHTGLVAILRGADSQIGTWEILAQFAGVSIRAEKKQKKS